MENGLICSSQQSVQEGLSSKGILDVLVVDDQPSAMKIVIKMLVDMGCFGTIDEAENGEAAWSKIKKRSTEQYDIVVTDIYMPKLDGIGLINRCRKTTFAKYLPFLAITGETKPEVLAYLGEVGVRDCLVKPFSFKLFRNRINIILQRLMDPHEKSYVAITHLIETGSYAEAFKKLDLLDKEESAKPRWHNLRGEIYLGMGKLDLARDSIEKALASCDTYLTALSSHAELEFKAGNLAAALASLEKADEISPLGVERKINLSDLLFQLDRGEDARKMLCKAAFITNDQETKLEVAEILTDRGYDKDADAIINKLLSMRNNNIEIYNKIGISLRKRTKYVEARNAYLGALSYYPTNSVIYYNLGILYLYKAENLKAKEYFLKALNYNPALAKAQEMIDCYCESNEEADFSDAKPLLNEIHDV